MRPEDYDRPFGGNGTRYQNIYGKPARWWQVSYDTSSAGGRAHQAIGALFMLGFIIACVIAILVSLA